MHTNFNFLKILYHNTRTSTITTTSTTTTTKKNNNNNNNIHLILIPAWFTFCSLISFTCFIIWICHLMWFYMVLSHISYWKSMLVCRIILKSLHIQYQRIKLWRLNYDTICMSQNLFFGFNFILLVLFFIFNFLFYVKYLVTTLIITVLITVLICYFYYFCHSMSCERIQFTTFIAIMQIIIILIWCV